MPETFKIWLAIALCAFRKQMNYFYEQQDGWTSEEKHSTSIVPQVGVHRTSEGLMH